MQDGLMMKIISMRIWKMTKIKISDYLLGKLTIDDICEQFEKRIREEIEYVFNNETARRS